MDVIASDLLQGKVQALQDALMAFEPYQPETEHVFHGGMYCRKVFAPQAYWLLVKSIKKSIFI